MSLYSIFFNSEPQIRQIVDSLPLDTLQTLFFTATWPREVQAMANSFLKNPIHLKIGESNELEANKAITQNIVVLREAEKMEELFSLLDTIKKEDSKQIPKTLIFVSRKAQCEDLVLSLRDEGFPTDGLHGDKSQHMRSLTMERFRNSRVRVLVATDVASRGLDVKDIEFVINYDFPSDVEDYVHRIGFNLV